MGTNAWKFTNFVYNLATDGVIGSKRIIIAFLGGESARYTKSA